MGRKVLLLAALMLWTLPASAPPTRSLSVLSEANAHSAALRKNLAAALEARGPDYVPRTRHFNEDGTPKYVNRLIMESSPYLIQHAHNPVDWYPWGDEAFATAKRLGLPVMLSVGYSTCHWCHVMEEQSFENEVIAAFLNGHFIAIKVDREERPDLDQVYITAVRAMGKSTGWPLTVWLTPDRLPFFGGTYFPPFKDSRSRRGFLPLLKELSATYRSDPEQAAANAAKTVRQVQSRLRPTSGQYLPRLEVLHISMRSYKDTFDGINGGLRRSPKFPSTTPVRLLLRYYRRTGERPYLDHATLTLEKMARGGIHDHLGGGFHRYTVDSRWLVPHFEKMLYDNALLAMAYLDGYQVTRREEFATVARNILSYVGREMTSPGGGFYSATDADSLSPTGEREEGWFFTWTPDEVEALLEPEEARVFKWYYWVTPKGNLDGRNILNVRQPAGSAAAQLQLPVDEMQALLESSRKKLYDARLKRPAPLLDDKILTAWNGLMISAMARGGFVLDEPDFIERAERAADFILTTSRKKGRLLRSVKDGRARHNGYLVDYAFLIGGLLDLYETTADAKWLKEAVDLQATLDKHYADVVGGYFLTSDDHEVLLAREKPLKDRAVPSGNSVELMNLLRLAVLTSSESYQSAAEKLMQSAAREIRGEGEMLMGLDFYYDTPKELVIVTPGDRDEAEPFLSVLRETYLPSKVVVVASEGPELEALSSLVPMLRGKVARKGRVTAYVCERGVCKLPATEVEVFSRQLGNETAGAP